MPFLPDLIVRSRRVVAPGATRPASIHIHNGKIVGVHVTDLVLRLNEAVLTADVTQYLIAKQGQASGLGPLGVAITTLNGPSPSSLAA